MVTFVKILNDYVLGYIYFPILLMFWIGRPRFIVRLLNKLLLVTEPYRNIPIFLYFTLYFIVNIIISYFQRIGFEKKVIEEVVKAAESGHSLYKNEVYENSIRESFKMERNIYIFFCFFVISIVYVKFSKDYKDIDALENKRNELKKKVLDFGGKVDPLDKKTN